MVYDISTHVMCSSSDKRLSDTGEKTFRKKRDTQCEPSRESTEKDGEKKNTEQGNGENLQRFEAEIWAFGGAKN